MKYIEFDILMEEMSQEQAIELLDIIVDYANKNGLQMGGGFYPTSDEELENERDADGKGL